MAEKKINTQKHIENFCLLGEYIHNYLNNKIDSALNINIVLTSAINKSIYENGFFTETNIRFALKSIAYMLSRENLYFWTSKYQFSDNKPKTIGVVLAGNIPLVGFHDFLCVIICGNKFFGKLSHNDKYLLPALAEVLVELDQNYKNRISFTDNRLEKFDAVITTGSNNTARYFHYYFDKYPNIIRKNRNSIAILNGKETLAQLTLLARDIFMYFGLGCRNVSKLFVPEKYDFSLLMEACTPYSSVIDHHKYKNNYDYYKTIFIMTNQPFIDGGFFLLNENVTLHNPVSIVSFEYYTSEEKIRSFVKSEKENLQCIISENFDVDNNIRFGRAQTPCLWDYADNVDTLQFLLNL
ncbi:MAG: acyl-CoA reductase [Bacteroidota bacterium]